MEPNAERETTETKNPRKGISPKKKAKKAVIMESRRAKCCQVTELCCIKCLNSSIQGFGDEEDNTRMVELSCVWKDARSSRCIQCNSRGDLCESVPAMISGDMADLCGIRTKIAELWNTRDEAEKKTINLIFYQVCASFLAAITAHREEWGVLGAKRSCTKHRLEYRHASQERRKAISQNGDQKLRLLIGDAGFTPWRVARECASTPSSVRGISPSRSRLLAVALCRHSRSHTSPPVASDPLFTDQVSRHPPRLTLPGFRRAIQIYGSEPNLLRSLKSSAASFTAWNAANPALYRDFVDAVDLADQLVQHWADMKPRLGARPGWLERKRVKHGIGFGTQQLDTGIFELRIGDLSSSERPLVLEPSQHDFPASPGIFRGS